jgi:hypothetical protein
MFGVPITHILALMGCIGGTVAAAYNAKRLKACSCSSNQNPSHVSVIAAMLFGIASVTTAIAMFLHRHAENNPGSNHIGALKGWSIGLKVITICIAVGATALLANEVKPTHNDCNCGGYAAKAATIGTTTAAVLVVIFLLLSFL